MTFEEWSKNKNKNKEKEEQEETRNSTKKTSSAKTFEEWSKERSVNKVDTSYINNFINSANEYLKTAEEEYSTVGWSNAGKTRAHRHLALKDLNNRADRIRRWLEINQGNLDAETYKNLVDALDSYSSSASSVYDTFKNADDYYEQWDTEDAYNSYVKQQAEIDAIKNSADFDDFVKKGTEVANPAWNETFDPINILGWKPFGEGKKINNMVTFAESNEYNATLKSLNSMHSSTVSEDHVELANLINLFMTDEEKSIYNYYIGKGDIAKADEYLTEITDVLKRRQAGKMVEQADDKALELVFSAIAGLDQFASGIKNIDNFIMGTEADPTTAIQYAHSAMSSNNDGVWGVANDLITTTSNMLPSILVGTVTGGVGGTLTLGTSAIGNAYAEMRNLGYNEWQSRGYAAAVGASEMVLQSALGGISKLGGKYSVNTAVNKLVGGLDNAIAKVAIKVPLNMASEGLEEALQTVLEPAFKAIMTGKEYEAAEWEEILYSGLLGALSAGIVEGVPSIIGESAANIDAKKTFGDGSNLVKEALEFSTEGSDARTIAEKYNGKIEKGKNLSGAQIRHLNEAIASNDVTKIKSAVEARLSELGEAGDVGKIAEILTKQATGENLTHSEKALLKNSKFGQRVSNELNSENIQSGLYSTEWAENIGTRRIAPESYNKEAYDLAKAVAGVREATEKASVDKKLNASTTEAEKSVKVSESGKTIYTDAEGNGEDVNVKRVVSTDGGLKVELDNGKTVSAKELEFGSIGEGLVYEMIARMETTPETANEILNTFNPTTAKQGSMLFNAVPLAYQYGKMGYEAGLKNINLPQKQKKLVYNRGRMDAITETNAKQTKAAPSKTNKAEVSTDKNGIIFEDGVKYNEDSANELQKVSMPYIEVIAKMSHLEVHAFESWVQEDGKRVAYINGELKRAPNGYFTDGNKIYIDLNAGSKAEGAMLYTMSHEVTHYIRRWNAKGFKELGDFLLAEYGKRGVTVDHLLEKQKDKIKKRYTEEKKALPSEAKLADMAYEELVADAMSDMFTDPRAYEKLAKLKQKNRSLWKKFGEAIKAVLDKLKSALGIYKEQDVPVAREAFEVRGFSAEVYEKLQDLYIKAFVEADANYAASVGETHSEVREALGKGSTLEVNENGEFTVGQTKDGTVLYNDRTYDEGGRETLKATLEAEGFSDADIKAALTIIDAKHELVKRLGKEFSEQDNVNKATLTTDLKDGHSVLSALVSNGDYPVNIDLLMVCKKRLAYQRVINRLCETGLIKQATLDSLAIAEINKILGKYGFETACLGCFVESRRIRIQEWAETICKEWNGIVDKMVGKGKAKSFNFASETFVKDLSNQEVEALSNELDSAYERDGLKYGRQTVVKKMEQLLREVPSLRKHLSVADLITPQGRTHLKALSAELNSLVACRYGSNTPKIVQDFNPYNHELAKYGTVPSKYSSLREYLYAIGGARMQSFSDFIIENWFDYCQIVADLTARKLPMHTYTKEISLAKLFGMTGIKINMSLIPDIDRSLGAEYAGLTKNAKGEYELIWADKDRFKATGGKSYMQSINFADAIALQADPRYSANVGTIAVGISDRHIRMMLDDARIRMVIPYHSSGMNPIFANLVGTDYYKDYTNDQNTNVAYLLDSKGNRRDLKLEKSQKGKLTSGFEFNETLQRLGDARATAQAYLDWCADASQHTITINGETYTAVLTPKFSDFTDHQNYYKLLEDFNTYDSITEKAAPQGDVQQVYPDDFDSILKDELTSREKYRQKQEPKWDTAMGEIESYLKKHTKADTIAYAKEHGIKLSAKDMKLSDRDNTSYAPTFYSHMGNIIDAIRLEKMGANGVVSYLKGKGVKDEEIKWSGIEAFLEGKKSVTKAELQEFVAGSQLVIEEEMAVDEQNADIELVPSEGGNKLLLYIDGQLEDTFTRTKYGQLESQEMGDLFFNEQDLLDQVKSDYARNVANTNWSQYKLDGGSNYRELVFKMPNSTYSNRAMRGHWGQEAEGVLAHARIQDMTPSDGKKMLFIEEIQSDWHNEGREKGYTTKEYEDAVESQDRLYNEYKKLDLAFHKYVRSNEFMTDPEDVRKKKHDWLRGKVETAQKKHVDAEKVVDSLKAKGMGDVPDAPFRNNYHEYVLKRLLRMAAEEGYDSIGWTTADIQSKRWSADYAEGYRIEYDQDIPKFLRKYGKKWGATVEKIDIVEGKNLAELESDLLQMEAQADGADGAERRLLENNIAIYKDRIDNLKVGVGTDVVWSMDIPDSMTESVLYEGQVMYSDRVTDQDTLDFLENQEHITTYKSFVEIDGKLYSPMATKVKGDDGKYRLTNPSEIGVWQQAEEKPDSIPKFHKSGYGYYVLKKDDGGTIKAAYNPYEHSSNLVLNDQFEAAYQRPNLVTVECIIPKSEMTSGYKAKYAKDSTGYLDWKSGTVAGKLKGNKRKVYLSRWLKPVRILSDAEVATMYKDILGTKISVPFNVVTPQLLTELEKVGVKIDYEGSPGYQYRQSKKATDADTKFAERDTDTVSNRTLLANALDSIAQNDIEKNKLAQYKAKIALIESEQVKLNEIRAKANELRFKKGRTPDETKQMRDLDFEANQTANRISTYDKQLLNLESTAAIKNVLEREKTMLRKRLQQKSKETLRKQKEKDAETVRELMTRHTESRKKAVESRNKTAMRHSIRKLLKRLNKLFKGGKERNVKEEMKEAVSTALALGDILFSNEISNADIVNLGVESVTEKESKLLNEYRDILMKKESNEDRIKSLLQDNMSREDAEQKAKNYAYVSELDEQNRKYDRRIAALNKELSDVFVRERARLNRTPVTALIDKLASEYLSLRESKDDYIKNAYNPELYNKIIDLKTKMGGVVAKDMSMAQLEAVHKVFTMVETSVRTANQYFRNGKFEDLQQSASAVMEEIDKLPNVKELGTEAKAFLKSILWNELTPYYAFDKIGSETFMTYYADLIKGQNTYARDVKEAKEFAAKTREKYGYGKWDLDKVYEFKLKDGRTFSTTLKHLLSIYAYSRREQALDHMSVGGFFHNDKSTFRKVKGVLKMVRTDSSGYKVDADTLVEIQKVLGDKKRYVEEMQDYLTKMGEKGNEVTRIMWGVDIFTEKVYFPLKSKEDFIKKSTETAQAVSLKNDGMTKETMPGASNPIVLEAFDDVWANHIDRMSLYHGMVIPIDNLNKVLHYGTWAGTESMAVSTMLAGKFTSAVNDYLNQFVNDLNGGTISRGATNPFASFFSKFKKTAVGASLSTVVQQPTAILRAMALIDAKYFIGKPNLTKIPETWAEIQEYAPVAIIKDIGGFDAGGGKQAARWINSDTLSGIDKVMNTVDEISMKGAEFADKLGWSAIWNAVKREVQATTDLAVGSKEFLEKCGERFTDIIVQTQVYDSTLSRSGYMRSKNDGVKMLTAFMGEPTLSINMIYNALINAKRGGKGAKLKAARTIGFVYASLILAEALASAIYALRDDDEDETYWEKYLQSLGGSVISDVVLAPITSLPGVKDIVSIFQGWDVERSDMAIFKDIKDAIDGLSSENKSPYRKVEDFAGAIASAFGLPLKNVLRTGREIYTLGRTIFDDISGGNAWEAFKEGVTGKETPKSEKLLEAIVNGDEARLEVYRKDYEDEEAFESSVKSLLRKGYAEETISRSEALDLLEEYGDIGGDDAYWMMKEWDYYAENGDMEGYSKYTDFHKAVETGKNLKTVINEYTAHGVEPKTLASQITSYFKPLYIKMTNAERASIKGYLLNAYALLGYDRTKKSKDIDKWLEE